MRARAYIKQLMREAGLAVREDTMGSIYGVLAGANPGAAAVGTGSHCDAIPLAGMYDGTVGGSPARCPLLPCLEVYTFQESSSTVIMAAAAAAVV